MSEEKQKIRCAQFLLDIFKEYGAEVLSKQKVDGETAQKSKKNEM